MSWPHSRGWTGITIDDCWKGRAIFHRQKQKKLIMLPSETMIWQPEFTDKTLSRKPGAVQLLDKIITIHRVKQVVTASLKLRDYDGQVAKLCPWYQNDESRNVWKRVYYLKIWPAPGYVTDSTKPIDITKREGLYISFSDKTPWEIIFYVKSQISPDVMSMIILSALWTTSFLVWLTSDKRTSASLLCSCCLLFHAHRIKRWLPLLWHFSRKKIES